MNKTNALSILLVFVFMISCLTFFSASATEEENPSQSTTPTVELTTAPSTEGESTTISTAQSTEPSVTEPTSATTGALQTRESTTKSTVENPDTNLTAPTQSSESDNNDSGYVEQYTQPATKQTKATVKTEKITEPTTMAKMVTDYSVKTRPFKWISMVVMIACVVALIVINVNYRIKNDPKSNKNGKYVPSGNSRSKSSNKLDVNAKFYASDRENNIDKTAVVDLSSLNKKAKNDDFKPKDKKDNTFGEKNNDDDLYI